MGKVILLVILLLVSHLNMLNWFITHKLEEKKKKPCYYQSKEHCCGIDKSKLEQ